MMKKDKEKPFFDPKNGQLGYTYMNWGPFVLHTTMPDYITRKLKIEGKKAKQNYNASLAGHLNNQYLYPLEVQKWFYKEIGPVIRGYREGHCKFHDIVQHNIDFKADDLWVNFMEAGDFNPVHTHSADYSFVYFIDVPKALEKEQKKFEGTSAPPGALMFEYTQQAKPRWATTGSVVIPKAGHFYMFPALLQHWVCPFKSKVQRISVSGNIRIMNKDKLPRDYF